jgi:dimethylglycine dehydrogenase
MAGLDRYVAFDKGEFVGREAALRERESPPARRLVLLEVDADDADASTDEGVWIGDRRVGYVTSGAYGHYVKRSLALAYLDRDVIDTRDEVTVYVVGDPRPARILDEPPYDPRGLRLRGDAGTSPASEAPTLASS